MEFRRVLVPLDGSVESESALTTALSLIGNTKAKLFLLHVLDTQRLTSEYSVVSFDSTLEELQSEAQRYLDVKSREVKSAGLSVQTFVSTGSIPEQIVSLARECAAELIVMTSDQSSGLRSWFGGGLAANVMRRSPLPVLVLPSKVVSPSMNRL